MTITQKLAAAVGGGKAEQPSSYPPASSLATNATTSASPQGAMEQAGAGAYQQNSTYTGTATDASTYGASQGAYTGAAPHLGGAAVGQTSAGDMVCVQGNVAAPVPVGEKKFIVTEDHAVQKQRVERWTEHQPVEREYRTTVAETGHVSAGATSVEGTTAGERIVNEHTCYPTSQTTITGVAGHTADTTNRVL